MESSAGAMRRSYLPSLPHSRSSASAVCVVWPRPFRAPRRLGHGVVDALHQRAADPLQRLVKRVGRPARPPGDLQNRLLAGVTLLDQFAVAGRQLRHAIRQGQAAGLQDSLAGRPLVGQRLSKPSLNRSRSRRWVWRNFNTSKYATRHAQARKLVPGWNSSNFCHSVTEVSWKISCVAVGVAQQRQDVLVDAPVRRGEQGDKLAGAVPAGHHTVPGNPAAATSRRLLHHNNAPAGFSYRNSGWSRAEFAPVHRGPCVTRFFYGGS